MKPGNCTPAIGYLEWKIKDFCLCAFYNVGDDKSIRGCLYKAETGDFTSRFQPLLIQFGDRLD